MYDTAHLSLLAERAKKQLFSAPILTTLEGVTEHHRLGGSTAISGHLGNLIIRVSQEHLSIKGSLCTYFHQNNFISMTRQDTKRAIEQLADLLHLPMHLAKVSRIDVATTMATRYPPVAYFSQLGLAKSYARLVQPESIRYENSRRVLTFYDKVAQSKRERLIIPELWKHQHALRYEARFLKRLPQQFNQAEVVATDLYQERFYTNLINRWVEEFESIQKVQPLDVNLKQALRSPKDFDYVAKRLLVDQLGGELAALELVDQNRIKSTYPNRTIAKRLKDTIKRHCQPPLKRMKQEVADATSELMTELAAKVKQVQQAYL